MQRTGNELELFSKDVYIESQKTDHGKNPELYEVKLINNKFEKVRTEAKDYS